MSYSCYLVDKETKDPIIFKNPVAFIEPNIRLNNTGEQEACIDITTNYSKVLRRILPPDGIKMLNGITAGDSVQMLYTASKKLNGNTSEDYWEPTEGNVKIALLSMLFMATLVPEESVWEICY